MYTKNKKNIILFIWKITEEHVASIENLCKTLGTKYRISLLTYSKYDLPKELKEKVDIVLKTNLKSMASVETKLSAYKDQVVAIINRWESTMPLYGRLFEFFPYLHGPSVRSMRLASNKLEMRKAFIKYDKKITPTFMFVKDVTDKTIRQIKDKVGFPCIIKPIGLSHGRLVTVTYYEDELKSTLKKTFKKLYSSFKKSKVEHEPRLIVENFMEGQMYSIDGYVNNKGKVFFTPMIDIKTGKDAGYDDLFVYLETTPSMLTSSEIKDAQSVVHKGIYALGLRSTSVHVELIRTMKGWKIVELGARVGGWRNEMYRIAFGFDHKMNDYLIHLGKKPIIKSKPKAAVAKLKFYPKKVGTLISIGGFQTVKDMSSVVSVSQKKKIGDFCDYAKHGHEYVVTFIIKANTRAKLLGEVRKIEQIIKIETK